MGVTWLACRMEKGSWCGRFQARSLKILRMLSRKLAAHVFAATALSYMHFIKWVKLFSFFFIHLLATIMPTEALVMFSDPRNLPGVCRGNEFCPTSMQWNAERLTTQTKKQKTKLISIIQEAGRPGVPICLRLPLQTKNLDRKLCSC